MSTNKQRTNVILSLIKERFSAKAAIKRQLPKRATPLTSPIRHAETINKADLDGFWDILIKNTNVTEEDKKVIADKMSVQHMEVFENNIENYIGTLKIPMGIMGPLRINGLFAAGDYYIPLATTEATLVASYGRGAKIIGQCGGCTTALLNYSLSRVPGFAFKTITQVGLFVDWVYQNYDQLKKVAESTTRHGELIDIRTHIEGNHVMLICEYTTGNAAGQNMTTIATQAICVYIEQNTPIKPDYWFLESNFSADKKASASSFLNVRGKKVMAEVLIPAEIIEKNLHTDIKTMENFWRMSALAGVMSGTIGVQGHYANGLTAFYLATGQDAACAAESSVGVTRLEVRDNSLYVSVTLPNIIVGTVGGGTKLPAQNVGLKILGLEEPDSAFQLAEICAGLTLAGEISIIGAFCAGHFARAHQNMARGTNAKKKP